MCAQSMKRAFSVSGTPANFVLAAPTKSPNANVANELSDRGAAISAGHGESEAAFFFTATAQSSSGNGPASCAVYRATQSGHLSKLFDVPSGESVAALFYHFAAQQLVLVAKDHSITTYMEQAGQWQLLTRMRLSAPRAGSEGADGGEALLCVWAGGCL